MSQFVPSFEKSKYNMVAFRVGYADQNQSIFKDVEYLNKTVKYYHELINNIGNAEEISKLYEGDHDSGFLYKKTVYDK